MNPNVQAEHKYILRLQRKLKTTTIASAVIIISFSAIILTGHIRNSISLIRFPDSPVGMNPMLAVSFLIAGITLLLFALRPARINMHLLLRIAGCYFIVFGFARYVELITSYDPQLDLLLFRERFAVNAEGHIVGRFSYTSGFLFILIGIAYILKTIVRERTRIMIQYLLLVILCLAFFSLISIIYGVSNKYFGPFMLFKMSLASSICFSLIATGLLISDHTTGVMAVLTSNTSGGRTARLLLPFLFIFPLMIGLVDRYAESSGMFQDAFGLALVSLVTMIMFFILIIRSARANNRTNSKLLHEIEERQKAVGEAHSADLFASTIYDNIPNMVFVKDGTDFTFKSINKAGEKLLGTTREDLMGKSDYDFFPKDEADFFRLKDLEVFTTNLPVISEEPVSTRHHGIRWLLTKKIGVRDASGKPLYMLGISEDITELKEKREQLNRYNAELEVKVKERTKELDKSEKRFHAIIQSAPDAMVIADENEIIQLVNTQTEKLFGYSKSELLGQPINFLIPDRNKIKDSMGKELFAKTKVGKAVPIEISLSPIQTSEGTLISVSIRDITRRKKTEKDLIESELMFRDLTQNVPGVIYQWIERFDGTYGFTYVSPAVQQYFKVLPHEMDVLLGYLHPDDVPRWRESIEEANKNETPWFFEGRLLYPDGEVKWWRGSSVMSLKNEEGRIYNGIMVDITHQKLTEEKIARNQKRFEAIFNSQYQFMGLMTPDGTLIEANETALNFAALQAADVIGKPFWECYWWAISERSRNQLRESIGKASNGEFIRYETDILGKGGIIATIDFSIKPVYDDNGRIILLIPEGRDITQRKLLEKKSKEQEEQIRLFIKHTPAAVAMFDRNMRYMLASDRWYADYGLEGEIIGRSHYDVFPEISTNDEWKSIHQRCLRGEVMVREQDIFVRKDGATHWVRWAIHPWTANNQIGGIIMFTELITDRIRVQEHLKKLNMQLTESNKDLEQFAYVASHDLQEPLRMVSSFLQLLEKKYKSQLDDTAHQYINYAVDGAERMKTLINDLLKFSRVGTATEERVQVDCNAVVQNVMKVYEQKINDNHATITVSPLPDIKANKSQVEQLFQNLIGNALKYRGKEAPYITIGCDEGGAVWTFWVKDNGIGIDKKFFEKIFVIFQRLHGKNEYGGTGIGLAICKKIVERHSGKIWIESEPGKGSCFYFTFPKSMSVPAGNQASSIDLKQ
jgi:PAS domain S-box-containing protein